MPDTDPPATTRRRGARRPGDATTTTTAVAVQTVTEHDPARLDQRITAIEGHLVEQDRHLAGQDLSMEARTVQVDAQFRQLRDGQAQLLGIIQALPPIPKGDAEYLHALAAEWPHDRVANRTEQIGRFDRFVDTLAPLVPIVREIAAERIKVADDLEKDRTERRETAQHFWQLAHAAVRWFLAASLTVLGGVPVGLSVYLFSSHQVSATTLALVLCGTVAIAIALYLFVAARIKAVGPPPATIPPAPPAP